MRWATVTLWENDEVVSPVGIHQDSIGLRLYRSDRGRISLLASIPGGSLGEWGVKSVERDANGNRVAVHRSAVVRGDVPATIQRIEFRGGCQCGHPLKAFRPPVAWEV